MLRILPLLLLTLPAFGAPPNIVIVLTDDQGYGDLSCHGNPILKTPHLDRLHSESVRFTDFHVSPTCAPTRSSLLSGKHEFKCGITHTILERERMNPAIVTLADTLKTAGYTTGIFGKWHLGDEDAYQPNKRGFDEAFIHGCGGIGQAYPGTSGGDAPGNSYFDPFIRHNGTFEKTKGYCTDVFFQQAKTWMGGRKQPFFCMITTNAPHAPLLVRPEDEAKYKGKVPDQVAKFFGMISNIDDNVGGLLDFLKENKLERDTVVIFMNDNGGTAGVKTFNAGMRGQKNTPYRGGTRGACFVRWPGTLAAGDRSQVAAHVDLYATLAEIAGAAVPAKTAAEFDGRSLVPVLKDAATAWPERTLVTHCGRWAKGETAAAKFVNCSLRRGMWQMVSVPKKGAAGPAWELFDLKTDPGEATDVSAKNPEVAKALAADYDKWWDAVQPMLVNEDVPPPPGMAYKLAFEKQFGKK